MGIFSKAKRAVKKLTKPIKRAARKLVPKEAAGIMQMAAPFMGPVAGPIAYGLGSLKQRGKINPLGMLLTMAPHLRFQGGAGIGQFRPTGYGGATGYGRQSLRNLFLSGEKTPETYRSWNEGLGQWTDITPEGTVLSPYETFGTPESMQPILGDYGTSIDKFLYGAAPVERLPGEPFAEQMGGYLSKYVEPGTKGWLGAAGEYDILGSKLTDVAFRQNIAKKGAEAVYKGISPLKSVAWGSAIIGGIQAGKYRDAQEAAQAAEDAARADGITDEAWLIEARREAAEFWDNWRETTEFKTGGRVGYQLGVGPVGGIGAMQPQIQTQMQPQLPMQTQMNPQMQTQMNPQMQTPPPREGGLGRLPIEADMRYTGGFMPYGGTEKADDVPARLSKNEFVFTADAVKAAGGGSVNKGAKKLYDAMKQLEAMA
jgi:hypothetical protein